MNAIFSKIKNLKPWQKALLGTAAGGAAGGGLAAFENTSGFYDNKKVQEAATLTGVGGGALAGLLLSHPSMRKSKVLQPIAAADIASLLGPKQLILQGIDSAQNSAEAISDYTDIQNELADKNVEISKNQLDTAIANKEIADRANETSEKWLGLSKKALPAAGGLAALLTALYAYNTFKEKKQPLDIKIDNKLPDREKNSMYIEIPSSKVSDKFYNQFSRELLFKDDEEKYLAAKDKEDKGMNLTSKEKKVIQKFEKAASAEDIYEKQNNELNKLRQRLNQGEKSFSMMLDSKLRNNAKQLEHLKKLRKLKSDLFVSKPWHSASYANLSNLYKENPLPMYHNPTAAFMDKGDFGLKVALRDNPLYASLDDSDRAMLFDYVKDKNTPMFNKIINMVLPMVQSLGLMPTQK